MTQQAPGKGRYLAVMWVIAASFIARGVVLAIKTNDLSPALAWVILGILAAALATPYADPARRGQHFSVCAIAILVVLPLLIACFDLLLGPAGIGWYVEHMFSAIVNLFVIFLKPRKGSATWMRR